MDPKGYEMGVRKVQASATFGHPYGMNSAAPEQFLKSHSLEPLLPERKPHDLCKQALKSYCHWSVKCQLLETSARNLSFMTYNDTVTPFRYLNYSLPLVAHASRLDV